MNDENLKRCAISMAAAYAARKSKDIATAVIDELDRTGFAIVPKEPSDEIIDAARKAAHEHYYGPDHKYIGEIIKAAIGAATSPQQDADRIQDEDDQEQMDAKEKP